MKQMTGIFVAAIMFLGSSLYATILCSHTTESYQQKQIRDYFSLGVDLEKFPVENREILLEYPAFFMSPIPPTYEQLKTHDLHHMSLHWLKKPSEAFTNRQSFETVLSLFKHIDRDVEYLFVGNGYYPTYLMAKTLFEGTPLGERIKFIAFSRKLSKLSNDSPEKLRAYFDSLEIGKSKGRRLVVIDSISDSSEVAANEHSIFRTSNGIRKYLMLKGLDRAEAIRSVISMGIPEKKINVITGVESVRQYDELMEKISDQSFDQANLPYFNPNILWRQAPFADSYHSSSNPYYWSGKYEFLDMNGFPTTTNDYRKAIGVTSAKNVKSYEVGLGGTARLYQDIIHAGHHHRTVLWDQIQDIVRQHGFR